MVGHNQERSSVRVLDLKKSIFSDIDDGIGLRVNLFMSAEPGHFVLDDASPEVSLADDAQVVRDSPYALSVVCLRDRAVGEVNDLVAVLEVADDLGVASDDSLHLALALVDFVLEHRCPLRDLHILVDSLLDITVG